jgi:uncharacterized protein (DUF1501 family)
MEVRSVLSRRAFLQSSTLLALAPAVPGFLARTARAAQPQRDGRVLVVIQLDGGNDGINTVVPFADEGYVKYRRALRLPKDRLIKVNDRVGLHPAMSAAGKLLEGGQLAIVQGVGYPNPSRSHFRSMAVWHSASTDPEEQNSLGWLGRGLDTTSPKPGETSALFLGSGPVPLAVRGRRSVASAIERTEDFLLAPGADARRLLAKEEPAEELTAFVRRSMLDAYTTADRLAESAQSGGGSSRNFGSSLGNQLHLVVRLLKSGVGARVFYTLHGGYDTHAGQLPNHARLLTDLSLSLQAFLGELKEVGLAERVVVLCFSEFGRRVEENASAGTDHGTAGPVFLAGQAVKAGLVGQPPSLTDLVDGDLKMGIDFHRVYATVLEDWLGLSAQQALGGAYERLVLFRTKAGSAHSG